MVGECDQKKNWLAQWNNLSKQKEAAEARRETLMGNLGWVYSPPPPPPLRVVLIPKGTLIQAG